MKSTLFAFAVLAAWGIPALAGPPLICHRLEIGDARSLPWGADSAVWNQPVENYNVAHLADETLGLLSPDAPVIVRMETIRRAVIYARHFPQAQKELILKLKARTGDAEARGDGLAMFDYGYVIEAMKEASWTEGPGGQWNAAMNLDGYPWVTRALAAGHDNPEMEFAAALIVMGRNDLNSQHEHAEKALAARGGDPLLARNVAGFFGSAKASQ